MHRLFLHGIKTTYNRKPAQQHASLLDLKLFFPPRKSPKENFYLKFQDLSLVLRKEQALSSEERMYSDYLGSIWIISICTCCKESLIGLPYVLVVNISIGTAQLLLGGFTAPVYASHERRDNVIQPFPGIYLEILHDTKHSLGRGPYAELNPLYSLKFLLYLYFSQSVEDADCFHE